MFVNVAKVDKLIRGTAKLIRVEGLAIALFDADGAFDALQNPCPLTAPFYRLDGSLEA
jgi:nitrite reductase/ring-hydroxylating ferredoxin subunit